jgi:AraC-like DNA-binding protein
VKAWAGLSKRELRGLAHAEAGFIQSQAERMRDAEASFADLAALTGYADQAHLSRITRKVTGLSPTELLKAINEQESYWPYRLF